MRAVCAWELGGGLGHVARLGAFGRALVHVGFEVSYALRDLHAAVAAGAWIGGRCLQAPMLARSLADREQLPPSHAAVLLEAGYAHAGILRVLVGAWRGLLEGARADVLVADHAPTAALAARIMRIPVVQFGDGFTVPPPTGDYFGASLRGDRVRVERTAAQVLASANVVLAEAGMVPLSCVEQLWEADRTILATYPELDHHRGAYRTHAYEGRLEDDGTDDAGWQDLGMPRVFAYLKPESRLFGRLLDALHGMRIHLRGYAGGFRPRTDARGVAQWADQPLPAAAIAGSDIVVGTGGHGLCCAALLAGKPMLLAPEFGEQWITAGNVEALGAGLRVHADADPRLLLRSLRRLLEDPGFSGHACRFSERYRAQRARATVRLAELAEEVRHLASRGRAT